MPRTSEHPYRFIHIFFFFYFCPTSPKILVLKCLLGTLIRANDLNEVERSQSRKKHESFRRPPCNYSVLSFRCSCIIIMEIISNTHTHTLIRYTRTHTNTFLILFVRSCVVVRLPIIGYFFFNLLFFLSCQQSWISFSETRDYICAYR